MQAIIINAITSMLTPYFPKLLDPPLINLTETSITCSPVRC